MQHQICQDYQNGIRGKRLAQKYLLSPTTICKILRANNIPVCDRSRRKYLLDETIFDKIDHEWKAYFLGLFYADGCVQKNKTLKISLHEKDKEILEVINPYIFQNNPLRYESAKKHIGKDGKPRNNAAKYFLNINSQKIWHLFQDRGCTQRKSFTIQFPTFIPDELLHHFLRGYFDGDGWISQKTWGIISSQAFCLETQRLLFQKINIDSHYHLANKVARLLVHKQKDNCKLYDYLYQDANIFLRRKQKKFKQMIK